ncbi:MAG: site-specific integrase [Comamonadaceae bacterium]|nr:MAG: site-specific integrase [Comamonadaceae bacterium]
MRSVGLGAAPRLAASVPGHEVLTVLLAAEDLTIHGLLYQSGIVEHAFGGEAHQLRCATVCARSPSRPRNVGSPDSAASSAPYGPNDPFLAIPPARSNSEPPQPVPVPLRDDQLRGLIDRADGPRAQLIVALVAIHALNVQELRALTIDALDNRAGTLTVTRARNRTHTLYLDDVTRELMRRWLSHRQEKWPTSPNPHLLISMYGAHAPNTPPLAARTITLIFRGLDLQAHRIRSDRILYEASVTEDPVLLMRVFGISTVTAMHYLHAAHPHRSRPSH